MKFQIKRVREVSSTNTLAKEYAEKNAKEGLVIVADYQTHGRGKPGRIWQASRGKNLLFSVLLRPPISPSRAPLVTQIACRAVAKALEKASGLRPTFKKPNDVMIQGKKICGVLVETTSSANKLKSLIIGIGLNVNASAEEMPPEGTSMNLLTKNVFSKRKILEMILENLKEGLTPFYDSHA